MKRSLLVLLLVPFLMAQQYNIPFSPRGVPGKSPVYNYDELADNSNITFFANFENCTPGSDCPDDGATSTYTLDESGGNEFTTETVNSCDEFNDPNIETTGGGLIKGSTQGIDVDGGDNRGERLECDNEDGSITGEATGTGTAVSSCLLVVYQSDSYSATANVWTTDGQEIAFRGFNGGIRCRYAGGSATSEIDWTSAVVDTTYVVECSMILGSGNDTFAMRVDGTQQASDTATDVGTLDLTGAGGEILIGTTNSAVDHKIDLMVAATCSSGCDCATIDLYDQIMGICNDGTGTTRCLTDSDCTASTCAP